MIMTNGIGATIGSFAAGAIKEYFVDGQVDAWAKIEGWQMAWYIFAGYSLVVAIFFALLFRYKGDVEVVKH